MIGLPCVTLSSFLLPESEWISNEKWFILDNFCIYIIWLYINAINHSL